MPAGEGDFHRDTVIHPELPAPGTTDVVDHILAGYAYHLNIMPLDAHMPDAGVLARAIDISTRAGEGTSPSLQCRCSKTRPFRFGGVAERAGVTELILTHYPPAGLDAITAEQWAARASHGFIVITTAGSDRLRRTLPRSAAQEAVPRSRRGSPSRCRCEMSWM